MKTKVCGFVLLGIFFAAFSTLHAQQHKTTTASKNASGDKQAKIESALSAAPESITAKATIMDWPQTEGGEMVMIREGSNDFTCLPDMPATPGDDPMCVDEPWMKALEAWMNKEEVNIDRIGFGYMLRGGSPESNTDPYAEGPTDDNEWMAKGIPHLMIIVPDPAMLKGLPVAADEGGPWVMWRDTPYAHIMAPMPQYQPPHQLTKAKNKK